MLRYHCAYMALSYLRENFSKERVDVMEKSLKNEKVTTSKARKRYMKVPSGKKVQLMEPAASDLQMRMHETVSTEGLMPMI